LDNGCRVSHFSYATSASGTVMKESIFFSLSYYQHPKKPVSGCQNAYHQQKTDEFTADNEGYPQVLERGANKLYCISGAIQLFHTSNTGKYGKHRNMPVKLKRKSSWSLW
jgi:hypothetical protein